MVSTNLFAGLDYYYLNPAYINSPDQPKNQLRFLSMNVDFTNNSLKFSDYNTHFNTDPIWEHPQKTTILNLIPESGFQINTDLSVTPIQFYSQMFNISVYAQHFANSNLTKDIFDLALFGNELNRLYDFTQNQVNTINYLGAAVGINYPIIKNSEVSQNNLTDFLQQLNLGARLHYQKGLFVTQTDSADGFILTTPDVFLASATLLQSVAQNASCFAFDIGATAVLPYNLTAGIALLNLNTGFSWQNPEHRLFDIKIDSFSTQRYLDLDFESIDSFLTSVDSSYSIPSLKTSIPAQILLQTSYQPIQPIIISLYYHQYLKQSRFITNFAHSLYLNINYTPIHYFQTGFSVTSNLQNKIKIGHSLNFILKKYTIELFAHQYHGYFMRAKGLDCGLAFSLQF
jgi:hypothetical protein